MEAYGGVDDPASHAWRGPTKRNRSMFLGSDRLYVYRIHQVVCANVVIGPVGEPGAILIRGGTPVEGVDIMVGRRGRRDHLADGPGKLCQALGITIDDDGVLLGRASGIWLEAGEPPARVQATSRIGISRASERCWRFVAT